MRCGVVVSAPDRSGYVAAVRQAESLGFDVVLCSDHLELSGRHSSHFSPIPALSTAAAVSERIRIGTSVLNQDLRHPAVLAREAASLDVLSDGRFELGLGAGWNEGEYTMAGIAFDPIGARVRRFREYVHVVKGVIAPGPFSFDGEFYTVREMAGEPTPIQTPGPPIMIGATGPKLLAFAAQQADIVSVNLLKAPRPGVLALEERIEWIRDAAGARMADLELQLPLAAVITGDERIEQLIETAAARGDHFIAMLAERHGVAALADSPMVLAGSPAAMAEQLAALETRFGITSVMVPQALMEPLGAVLAAG